MPLRTQKILMNFESCQNRIHFLIMHGNTCICNVEFLLTFVKVMSITHLLTLIIQGGLVINSDICTFISR